MPPIATTPSVRRARQPLFRVWQLECAAIACGLCVIAALAMSMPTSLPDLVAARLSADPAGAAAPVSLRVASFD